MAKPQCLVFLPRHKGLTSLKFGSVHWLKSWMCSFSTGLAQNNWAASWPSASPLYHPGLDSGCSSAKLVHSTPQTDQSVCQRVTAQNWPVAQFSLLLCLSFFFFPPYATCDYFLYIFPTRTPAFSFGLLCKMLPQHLNLSWTARRADVDQLTTLNLCDTEPVLPVYWLSTANHSMLFHYTFDHEMSNPHTHTLFITRLLIFQCGCMVHFLQTSHTKRLKIYNTDVAIF